MRKFVISMLLLGLFAAAALAQPANFNTTGPGDIVQAFRDGAKLWTLGIIPYAKSLFWLLALLDFAWTAACLLLEGADFHGWTTAIVRKVMFIGFWWTVLLSSPDWIQTIIGSFDVMGKQAIGNGGLVPIGPSQVFVIGLKLGGALIDGGVVLGNLSAPPVMFLSVVATVIIIISFAFIALSLVMTWIESFLVMSVGYIYLGFAGSNWSVEYAMKYISLAVGIGIKIMLLYCLVGVGSQLATGWANEAAAGLSSPSASMVCLDLAGGSLIFALCCWHIPKLFSSVVSGAPSMGHGEIAAAVVGLASAAQSVALMTSRFGGSGVGGAGAAGASGGAGGAGMSGGAAGSPVASNGGGGSSGGGSSVSSQVASVKAANTSVSPPVTSNGKK